MAALHHGVDEEAGDDHTEEYVGEVGILGDILQALGTVEQLEAQQVIDVVQGDTDDLAKAQSQDGQIVTGQAKGRDADDDTEETGHDAGQHQTQRKGDAGRQRAVFGDQSTGIGTHGHETGMAQRQLAQITSGHVQRDSQDDIDAHGEQNFILISREHILRDEGEHHEQQCHQHGVHQVAHRHFQGLTFQFVHVSVPLTPFPAPCGRGSQWA